MYSLISVYAWIVFPNWIQRHLANHSHYKRLSRWVYGFLLNDPINFKVVLISVQPNRKGALCAPFQITQKFFAHCGYKVSSFALRVI